MSAKTRKTRERPAESRRIVEDEGGRQPGSRRRRPGAVGLVLAGLVFCTLAAPASAQQPRSILWLIDTAEGATVSRDVLIELFGELLAGAEDAEHIIDVPGLAEYMRMNGYPVPECLWGRGTCVDLVGTVAESLRLDVIAEVRVFGSGQRMELTVTGVPGGSSRTLEFSGANLRATAFEVVTDFIGASGTLAVTSRPTGASLFLDGEPAGQTPYQGQVPAGIYTLRLELDGYQPFEQVIELRPGQSRLVDTDLVRQFALVTVQTAVPGATVSVDGEPMGEPPGPFRLEPGSHTILVEAPDHTPEERRLELEPGVDRRLQIELSESPEAIRRRRMGYIYDRPFYLRGAFRYAGTRSGFNDATGSIGGVDYTVVCPQSPAVGGGCDSNGIAVNAVGLDVMLGYAFKYVEVGLVSLSYTAAQIGGASGEGRFLILDPSGGGTDERTGTLTGMQRLDIRPLALGGRLLFTDTWSIFGHAGLGWYAEFFDLEDYIGQTGGFKRTGLSWMADVGIRYHLNDTLFFEAAFDLGGEFSHDDTNLTTAFTLGLAVTWEDFLGINRLFGGGDGDDEEPAPVPSGGEGAPPTELDRTWGVP